VRIFGKREAGQGYAEVVGFLALLVIVGLGAAVACSYHRVDAGAIGIKVDYGQTQNGKPHVEIIPTTGVVMIWPGQQVRLTDYKIQQHTMKMVANSNEGMVKGDDSVQCHDKNGNALNIDSTTYWRVTPENAESLYFLRPGQDLDGGLDDSIAGQLVRPAIRNTLALMCSTYTYEEIFGPKRADFFSAAKDALKPVLEGVYITLDNFQGGEIHPDGKLTEAIQQKAISQQAAERALIDVQTATNNATQKKATADGDAYAIQTVNNALSSAPNYIGYMNAQANLLEAQRFNSQWDGKLPTTVAAGAGTSILLPTK